MNNGNDFATMSKFFLYLSTGGSSSSTLQYVWKELLSNVECEKTGNAGQIDETMLCAGEAGKDACQVSILL